VTSDPADIARRRLLGSALGVGRLPKAPGTWGSLATVLLVALLLGAAAGGYRWEGLIRGATVTEGDPGPGLQDHVLYGMVLLLLVMAISQQCASLGRWATVDWGREDPGPFVLDEVAGQLLALVPVLPGPPRLLDLALGFALFRLFDITKPFPCRRLEKVPRGWGIVADDLAAGVYAAVLLGLARAFVLPG
jgi:phosphatidylglycerophosphatase A